MPATATISCPATPLTRVPYAWPAAERLPIALVGEAPGAAEVAQGMPFVGRSGQLLNRALAAAGIDRAQVLVANAFRLRPPDNAVAHFFSSRRQATAHGWRLAEEWGPCGSTWLRAEYAPELAALATALTAYQPRLVIALGRTALWATTGQSVLGPALGQLVAGRWAPPVLATWHPSFLLRGQLHRFSDWTAMLAQARAVP